MSRLASANVRTVCAALLPNANPTRVPRTHSLARNDSEVSDVVSGGPGGIPTPSCDSSGITMQSDFSVDMREKCTVRAGTDIDVTDCGRRRNSFAPWSVDECVKSKEVRLLKLQIKLGGKKKTKKD